MIVSNLVKRLHSHRNDIEVPIMVKVDLADGGNRIIELEDRLAEAYQMVGNIAYNLAETKEDQQDNITALLDLLSKD